MAGMFSRTNVGNASKSIAEMCRRIVPAMPDLFRLLQQARASVTTVSAGIAAVVGEHHSVFLERLEDHLVRRGVAGNVER